MNSNKNKHHKDNGAIKEDLASKILEIIRINPNVTSKQIASTLNKVIFSGLQSTDLGLLYKYKAQKNCQKKYKEIED